MIIVSSEYNRNTGLGNKLFSWSRAKIFSKQHNCKMVEPQWFSPRGAALIRGGVSYKSILSRFWLWKNLIPEKENITKAEYRRSYQNLEKKIFRDLLEAEKEVIKENTHYIFSWHTSHNFDDLQEHHQFIFESLHAIVAPKHRKFIEQYESRQFIGLHIRTGKDFISKSSGKVGSYLTEVEWFAFALQELRKKYGNLPAYIISDGGAKQLQPLLKIENTTLVKSDSAISDILILANARVLLGSGGSSFSAWASFLGGMDTFSSKETPFDPYHINYKREDKHLVSTI